MNMQNNVSAASGPAKVRTPWSEFWRKFKRQRMTLFAGSFIGLLVLIAVFWPWIVPYDPENYFDYDMLNAGPSLQHWFGAIFSAASLRARAFRWPRAFPPCWSARSSGRCSA